MKPYDVEDSVDLWKKFKQSDNIYNGLPTVKEIEEFYDFLKNGGNYVYATSFEDCEDKEYYWKRVYKQYKKYDFILPYSPGMGYEHRLEDIYNYYSSDYVLGKLEEIIYILEEISNEFFLMDHVSLT